MMDVTITINCDNAAFDPDPGVELWRILAALAHEQHAMSRWAVAGLDGVGLRDINGNKVGEVHVTDIDVRPRCDMHRDCFEPIAYIDDKGYAYCTIHGKERKWARRACRKLRPAELKRLKAGQTVRY